MSVPNKSTTETQVNLPPEFEEGPPGCIFYRGSVPFEDLPFPTEGDGEDFDWAWYNDELHRQYDGQVVAVHSRKVWGAGKDRAAAWDQARQKPGCPSETEFAFVPMLGMPRRPEPGEDGSQG